MKKLCMVALKGRALNKCILMTLFLAGISAFGQANPGVRQGQPNTRLVFHDTGGDDAYVTPTPGFGACFSEGRTDTLITDFTDLAIVIELIVDTTNTGAATLNACDTGALEISADTSGTDLENGDLVPGKAYTLVWFDGTPDLWLVNLGGTGGGRAVFFGY